MATAYTTPRHAHAGFAILLHLFNAKLKPRGAGSKQNARSSSRNSGTRRSSHVRPSRRSANAKASKASASANDDGKRM
jgi:hypothetical protein